jgi:ABC-type uncharacterized transport system involved in gliding motility auxiliary subunit
MVLAQQGAVPDDASIVVIAGPRNDFFPPEIDALKKYLAKGGKLLMQLDPPDKADSPPLTNLIALAHDWGMDVGTNLVIDVSGMGQLFGASEGMPVAANYPSHPITDRFTVMTVYPLARSVTPVSGGVNSHIAQPIVQTSDRSWSETNLKGIFNSQPAKLDEAEGDKRGPITIAAAVSAPVSPADGAKPPETPDAPKPETRVVVFGDSDFAANAYLGFSGNRDLFMNTMGWLSQQENLISIRWSSFQVSCSARAFTAGGGDGKCVACGLRLRCSLFSSASAPTSTSSRTSPAGTPGRRRRRCSRGSNRTRSRS